MLDRSQSVRLEFICFTQSCRYVFCHVSNLAVNRMLPMHNLSDVAGEFTTQQVRSAMHGNCFVLHEFYCCWSRRVSGGKDPVAFERTLQALLCMN